MDGLKLFFAFDLYYSLFHMLMIKSSYRVDRVLFNFLFNSFEILYWSLLVLVIKKEFMLKVLIHILNFKIQILKLVEKVIHIIFI